MFTRAVGTNPTAYMSVLPCGSDIWHQRAISLISEPQVDPKAHHHSCGLYFGEVANVAAIKEALTKL